MTKKFKDDKGQYFMKDLMKEMLAKGETVNDYWFRKMSDSNVSKKTTYSRWYKEWNWIIGAGFYHDDLTAMIAQRKGVLGGQNSRAGTELSLYIRCVQ